MKRTNLILGTLILSLLFPLSLSAKGREKCLIMVEVKDMSEKSIVILKSDGRLKPLTFQLKDPPRLRLYLPNTVLSWKKEEIFHEGPLVKRVKAEQYSEKPPIVRTDIYLDYPANYTLKASEKSLTVELKKEGILTQKEQIREAEKYYKKGKCHYKRREYQEAITELEKALDFDLGLKKAENYILRTKEKMREEERLIKERLEKLKFEEAKKKGQEEEVKKKESIAKHYTLGKVFYQEDKFPEAVSQWDKVLALDPRHKDARKYRKKVKERMARELARVRKRHETERTKQRKQVIAHYYKKGKVYYERERFSLALVAFRAVLKLDPENEKAVKYQKKCKKSLAEEVRKKEVIKFLRRERKKTYRDKISQELKEKKPEVVRRGERVAGGQVKGIEVRDLPLETGVIITLQGEINYVSFELEDPPRLVIDIPDAMLKWETRVLKVEKGAVQGIRCSQFQEKPPLVRVVIDLKRPGIKYQISGRDKQIIISINTRDEKGKNSVLPEGAGEYTIEAGDLLDVSVWQYAELAQEVTVDPGGKIFFPPVGDIKVKGLTLSQLDEELTSGLTSYIEEPQVTVVAKKLTTVPPESRKPKEIFISGQVKNPGVYRFREKMRFTGALTLAGGVTKEASFEKVMLTTAEGEQVSIDLNRLLIRGERGEDAKLRDGDTIYIFGAKKVFVLGEVNSPGAYDLPGKEIGVLEGIINLAKGFTKQAVLRTVILLRGDLSRPRMVVIDINRIIRKKDCQRKILLQSGDIIYVPNRLVASTSYVLQEIRPLLQAAKWLEE